jgi:DNA-binding response OmpR family regulator
LSGPIHHALYLRAATSLGATAALEKPFGPDQLLSAVSELLRAM